MENKHTNYLDSRTEKEREEDSKIKVETTIAVSENKNTWEERFDEEFPRFWKLLLEFNSYGVSDTIENKIKANKVTNLGKEAIRNFLRHEIDLAVKRREMDIRNIIVKLRNEFTNTPISERGNGWDWLGKVEEKITHKERD